MTKCRVGIFGGSFSPPHLGHLHGAKMFIEAERLDKLYVIPAYVSPGKASDGIDPFHRLAMCRMTFKGLPNTEVLDIEIKRGGNSYTADTLSCLAGEDRQLIVLCGTDTALSLDTWHDPKTLFSLADFVCMPREEENTDCLLTEKNKQYFEKYGKTVRLISAPPYPVSSTAIRRMVREGIPCVQYLPPDVADYIAKNELYQLTDKMIDALREEVKKRLPEKRMAHVLGVEEQIVWLGKMLLPHHILRLRAAALLHDIAKDTPDSEQATLCERLGVSLTEKEKALPPVIHAKSGAFIAERDFPRYVDSDILYAILNHTVGDVAMPLFARLLMLADFTEKGRKWERCQDSRRYLAKIEDYPNTTDKQHYFDKAFYYALFQKYDYIASVAGELDSHTKDMLAYYREKANEVM